MTESSASSGQPKSRPWGPQYPGWCNSCGGNHDPDPPGVTIDFKGRRFTEFHCLCCDRKLCARQFAFGRQCGFCDTGSCQRDPKTGKPLFHVPGHNLSAGHRGPFLKYSDPIADYEAGPGEFVPPTAKLPRTP